MSRFVLFALRANMRASLRNCWSGLWALGTLWWRGLIITEALIEEAAMIIKQAVQAKQRCDTEEREARTWQN